MVAFADLRLLDTGVFRTAAAAYARLGETVALHADDVDIAARRVARWGGEAGTAAELRARRLYDDCDVLQERLSELDRVLSEHASQLAWLQRMLVDIVVEIGISPAGPLRIDLNTGVITVNVVTGDGIGLPAAQVEGRQRLAQRYAAEIGELLEKAAQVDADTAGRLQTIMESVAGGRPSTADALLAGVPDAGTDPQTVRQWWDGLTPQEREFLIRQRPDVIGWLDGVPAADRDEANRLVLSAVAAGLEARKAQLEDRSPAEAQHRELDEINVKLRGIDAIRDRMGTADTVVEAGAERAYLLGFDQSGNGRAIVAIGDPDTAGNLATYVPGTGAGLRSVGGALARADLMTSEANAFDPSRRTSTIMWIGYDAPQSVVPQAQDPSWAQDAAGDLNRFQDGLRTTHEKAPAQHTVIGHSYGSTVIGVTAGTVGIDADNVIFVGSPGIRADHVNELNGADGQPLPADRVWSSHARRDPIQYASYTDLVPVDSALQLEPADQLVHGRNPTTPEFGVQVFTSDPGSPVATGKAHSQYWDPYSSSLRNITYIVTGRYAEVS